MQFSSTPHGPIRDNCSKKKTFGINITDGYSNMSKKLKFNMVSNLRIMNAIRGSNGLFTLHGTGTGTGAENRTVCD